MSVPRSVLSLAALLAVVAFAAGIATADDDSTDGRSWAGGQHTSSALLTR
jgi:hypothetical protein